MKEIQILTPIKTMIRKLLCDILLIADNHPTFLEKVKYFITIVSAFAPVAYFMNEVSSWFHNNQQFVAFVTIAVFINIWVGWVYHTKMGTFSWEFFFKRNGVMIAILIVTYLLLEMLRMTMGPGIVGDGLKALIQVSTLLYPSSKALKNLYILSNKQFPPAFIMERLYNFEKTGNLNDLFPNKNKNENNENQ
jgi:hypothetical protein